MFGSRIVIPHSLRERTLSKIHQGHQGIIRCCLRAKLSVWWPKMSQDIHRVVEKCSICMRESRNRREPLIPTKLPIYPWQKVGTDLFQIGKQHYLIVVDYYSHFPEVIKLSSTTSQAVISALKPIFARYGIPEIVYSDNGPQYQSGEFKQFAREYDFNHVTSSPHFPWSNGLAERTVQTVKKLLQDSNPCLALLNFRATPLPWCRLCPSQLLMGRPLRSNLPSLQENLVPDWSHLRQFAQMD